jgi:hypothetical protein
LLATVESSDAVEGALAAGRLGCPGCGGPLAPWGWARPRTVRLLDGERRLRPRRACCRGCGVTHVLLPACCVARRRDGAEVIGAALVASARGAGHRPIAERLGRPPGTVRGWLRAARGRSGLLRASGSRWAFTLDTALGRVEPAGSSLADAVEALATAARAWLLRLGWPGLEPWEIIVLLTGGRLLCGRPRDPPGF